MNFRPDNIFLGKNQDGSPLGLKNGIIMHMLVSVRLSKFIMVNILVFFIITILRLSYYNNV
jgi:hypothetical protein